MSSLDDQWRRLRRCAREVLTQSACRNHLDIQNAEATQLLYEMLTRPEVQPHPLLPLPYSNGLLCRSGLL